jgi:hypothetical protein
MRGCDYVSGDVTSWFYRSAPLIDPIGSSIKEAVYRVVVEFFDAQSRLTVRDPDQPAVANE